MCEGCWEDYGAEKPGAAARAALEPLMALEEQCLVGGNLHIVTDDYNVEDDNLKWCKDNSDLTPVEQAVYDALMPLSEAQRAAALALRDGYTN